MTPAKGAGSASGTSSQVAPPPDLVMARTLWPVLLASALGLVPFTVFGTFLVTIAADGGWDVAAVGGMRGLGGVAALTVGVLVAPLLDRVSRTRAAAWALALLAAASLLGTAPSLVAVAGFCLLVGAATSVLNPALTATAADAYSDPASAGRAATLVTATQSLTAMLAAPLVALPALAWGWRGALALVAAAALASAAGLLRRGPLRSDEAVPTERIAYLSALRLTLGRRRTATVLLVSLLRTTAFMGWLAYVAALYDDRFGLSATVFALVWTLSGAAFFLGNLLTGRVLARVDDPRRVAGAATVGCLLAALGLLALVGATALPVALLGTAVLGAAHACVAACVTTLLVRSGDEGRGTVLGLNAAAQSLGVFAGAALGAFGLAVAGWPGVAVALGAPTLVAAVAVATLVRREGDA